MELTDLIMTVGGGVIGLLLYVVAFYLKGMVKKLDEVVIKMVVIEERINNNHTEIFRRLAILEKRVEHLDKQ